MIWKYNFEIKDVVTIEMPKGAEIVAVDTQFGKPTLWALVNPDAEAENRVLRIFGTGHPIKGNNWTLGASVKYLGTFQVQDGQLVFHVFE